MNKFLIVDGSNLLFQMFFGMPSRILNEEGKAIQRTLGFIGALLKIIRMVKATHVAVLFDGEHGTQRNLLDEGYKGNRPDYGSMPEEDSPFSQLPDVYKALDHLGIRHTETVDCETDDWVAEYAFTYGRELPVVIASFDSDFFQLITENVSVLRYRGDRTAVCTPDYVKERFGILPSQYTDFKSLVGDPADNIKGIPKVGVKTAAALLNRFGSLEKILERLPEIQRKGLREALLEHRERLLLNRRLIGLEGGYALPFALEELSFEDSGITTVTVLKEIGLRK